MTDSKRIVSDPQFQKVGKNAESIVILQGDSNDLANEFFTYGLNFQKICTYYY
ncbi:hypothetical protein HMSSN139_07950 [Paenibacillus sp. HMSSN-139]|nr:hypothetical protein HMSSN139_07950 [Paenibacillus sp. HMSSN-139]